MQQLINNKTVKKNKYFRESVFVLANYILKPSIPVGTTAQKQPLEYKWLEKVGLLGDSDLQGHILLL